MADMKYAVWLLPESSAEAILEEVIRKIASQFELSRFIPHATLCSGEWSGELPELRKHVEAIASETAIVEADVVGVEGIDSYFQFFYLALDPEALQKVSDIALESLREAHLPSVGPHVSLMYSDDFTGIDRKALAGELKEKILERIVFKSLALVFPRANDWRDVANRQVECRVPFGTKIW